MRNVLIFKKRPQINRIIRINSLVTSLYKNLVNPINPGSKKTFILYLLSYILLAQRVTPWAVKKTLADYADATDVFCYRHRFALRGKALRATITQKG